jgi:ABC-type Fe3+/spermidine/putrescine transport system ATPase subunit
MHAKSRGFLAVRPERIAIAPVQTEGFSQNAVAGKVAEVVYLGDAVRVRVALDGEASAVVKRPIAAAGGGLSPGAAVALAWEPEHARVFPVDGL